MAQISFISSLYKQKVYTAIDGLTVPEKPGGKIIIMFLPKGEWMDSGLVFCNYMAKKRGYKTLFLGSSFPAEELPDILAKNPDSILFSIATMTQINLTLYYTKVLAACGNDQKVMISGNQMGTVKSTDNRLVFIKDYTDFKDFLDNPQ